MKTAILSLFLLGMVGWGQTPQPTSGSFSIVSNGPEPILVCERDDAGKPKNCKIAEGHTLDEAIGAAFESMKEQEDAYRKEVDGLNCRIQLLAKIALILNHHGRVPASLGKSCSVPLPPAEPAIPAAKQK